MDARGWLEDVATTAVARCDGRRLTRNALGATPRPAASVVLAVGKAANAMAAGALDVWGEAITKGLIVTKDGHGSGFAPAGFEVRWAAHPIPDERSERAAEAVLRWLHRLDPSERLVVLLSGGTSSLLAAPVAPLTRVEVAKAHATLLGAGIPVESINAVRAALGRAAGGRLAAACPAQVEVFVLSDVLTVTEQAGDPGLVGSGPFAVPRDRARAAAIADDVVGLSSAVRRVVHTATAIEATTPPHHVIASHATLVAAARDAVVAAGGHPRLLPASDASLDVHVERLVAAAATLQPGEVLITGGEPAVRLPPNPGRGGRCQQLALQLAQRLAGMPVAAALVASDGTDGPTDAAGAVVDGSSWAALCRVGDPDRARRAFDSEALLAAAGLSLRTGPTDTNLLDLHLVARAPLPGGASVGGRSPA